MRRCARSRAAGYRRSDGTADERIAPTSSRASYSPVSACPRSAGLGSWRRRPLPRTACSDAIAKSLTGDVYAEPSLIARAVLERPFTEGWDEARSVRRPAGEGRCGRVGLNSFDGVFYRLGVATYGYSSQFLENGTSTRVFSVLFAPSIGASSFASTSRSSRNRGASGTDYETNSATCRLSPAFSSPRRGRYGSRSTWPSEHRPAAHLQRQRGGGHHANLRVLDQLVERPRAARWRGILRAVWPPRASTIGRRPCVVLSPILPRSTTSLAAAPRLRRSCVLSVGQSGPDDRRAPARIR